VDTTLALFRYFAGISPSSGLPAPGGQTWDKVAVAATTQNFAPGTITDTVVMPNFAYLPANVEIAGNLTVDGNLTFAGSNLVNLTQYGQQQLATQRAQALTPWFAGLANRQAARCNVAVIGDSITEGQHAVGPPSTGFQDRWIARLRDSLRSAYPTPFVTGGGQGFIGVQSTGETSFTWPTTINGSPTPASTLGPKSSFLQLNNTGQSVVYTLNGDSADIMWTQAPGGGTFSWAVDGGSATNVSTSGGSIVDGKVTHISLGSAGQHTLTLAWVSGNADVTGVVEYWGDFSQGIQVHDCGHFGWTTQNWITVLANGTTGPAAAIKALNPNLIIIALGVNDQFNNVLPATFQTNLQTIITDLQAVLSTPFPSFVLCMYPPRTSQSSYTYPWAQYVNAAWNVAGADTSGPNLTPITTVMDFTLGPRMPGADTDTYSLWQGGDLVHPSNKGHQMIGDYMTRFLTGS